MNWSTALREVVPAQRSRTVVVLPRPVSTPYEELTVRLAPLCAGAVDSLEVAAGLESDGVNDAVARRRYGSADVFELAERLYIEAPRRPAATPVGDVPWRVRPGSLLLRTAVFSLPGLPLVASARLLAAPGALVAVLCSLLMAWTASEALSYLGAAELGRSGKAGAAAVLRRCAGAAAALVVPAAAAVALAVGAGAAGTTYATGQAVYLLSATVLLVLGAERRLFAALLPGTLVSAAALAGALPVAAVAVAAALTVTAVAVLAVDATWGRGGAGPRRVDTGPAAASALFGLLAGALVTFGVVAAIATGGDVSAGALTALPITLSMGAAEGLLVRFRRRSALLLTTTHGLRAFTGAAARELAGALAGYLIVLAALAGGVSVVVSLPGARSATAVLLGGALFLALALRSFGYTGPVLGACGAALVGEAALVRLGPWMEAGTAALLLSVLMLLGLTVLTRASAHR